MAEVENDVVTTFFQFPPELKTACKQYLVYFAQFLLDIGIEADTEIREELHETLFKIIPKDKGESLERIKEALEIFLNMPGMPNMDAEIAKSGDIAAMQLQANIHHLKGQMMLMQAAMQMKDVTIETLQLSNYQLKEIVEKKESEKAKTEDIIPGIVAVTKLEGKGLSINLPEILRRLKRRF